MNQWLNVNQRASTASQMGGIMIGYRHIGFVIVIIIAGSHTSPSACRKAASNSHNSTYAHKFQRMCNEGKFKHSWARNASFCWTLWLGPMLDPIPEGVDVQEAMMGRGWSDGLPLVAPSLARVNAFLAETQLDPNHVLGECPPMYAPATVRKVAANAVMAGCEPRQFRVVIAAVEAMLDPRFGLHGLSATTMGATPLVVVNGPIRHEVRQCLGPLSCSLWSVTGCSLASPPPPPPMSLPLWLAQAGLNSEHGALQGSGSRANITIGRAIKLVLQNIGCAKLGGTESSTIGSDLSYITTKATRGHRVLDHR